MENKTMKKAAAVLALVLGLMAQGVNANILYFYGKVDSVTPVNPLIKAGDAAYFEVEYSISTNAVSKANVTVHRSVLNLIRGGSMAHVFIDANPADGAVQWSVFDGPNFVVDVASNAPGGVMPCIDNFDLGRTFQIFFNGIIANGTITALPRTRTGN
jgi:hypothetical protein